MARQVALALVRSCIQKRSRKSVACSSHCQIKTPAIGDWILVADVTILSRVPGRVRIMALDTRAPFIADVLVVQGSERVSDRGRGGSNHLILIMALPAECVLIASVQIGYAIVLVIAGALEGSFGAPVTGVAIAAGDLPGLAVTAGWELGLIIARAVGCRRKQNPGRRSAIVATQAKVGFAPGPDLLRIVRINQRVSRIARMRIVAVGAFELTAVACLIRVAHIMVAGQGKLRLDVRRGRA